MTTCSQNAAPATASTPGNVATQVAQQAGLTRKEAQEAVNTTLQVIVDALRGGQTVGLPGLGTLSVKATAARTGVKPGTSEKIQIPAGKKVAFKVATDLNGSL